MAHISSVLAKKDFMYVNSDSGQCTFNCVLFINASGSTRHRSISEFGGGLERTTSIQRLPVFDYQRDK